MNISEKALSDVKCLKWLEGNGFTISKREIDTCTGTLTEYTAVNNQDILTAYSPLGLIGLYAFISSPELFMSRNLRKLYFNDADFINNYDG